MSSNTRNPKISPKCQKYSQFWVFGEDELKSKNRPKIWTRGKLLSKADIWITVPHLCLQTPGTQKSAQNFKNTVSFGFFVKVNLNLKTDQKFGLEESFNQKKISG